MMEYFAVEGGWPLEGQVPVHGAKNSALPILAATLLADGESIIHNCPSLTDCAAALEAAGWTVLETQSADGWFAYTCRR